MDPANMTDEQKRRAAGLCAYNLVSLLCMAAFFCGLYSTAYCSFVKRNVTFEDGVDSLSLCTNTSLPTEFCRVLLDDHGVGFWAFQVTVPEDQKVCLSYTQFIPGLNNGFGAWVEPDFDTKFNSARALALTSQVCGAMAFFTFLFSVCCPVTQERLKGLYCYFFLACLFQGLSLLIFRSEVCEEGFFEQYFENVDDVSVSEGVAGVSCSLDTGSKLAVSATVLYFVCMLLVPSAIAPNPMRMPDGGQEEEIEKE